MGKFNLTGQVATLSNAEAVKAQASGAVTDAGYLGGSSWIKAQLDARKAILKDDPTQVEGYEFINFSDAKETLLIPDGAFDFFDLTYDLTQKDVRECVIQFLYDVPGRSVAMVRHSNDRAVNLVQDQFSTNAFNGRTAPFTTGGDPDVGQSQNPVFIVSTDYKECGFAGTVTPGAGAPALANVGYKISGQNPPTDDSGNMYQIDPGPFSNYQHSFAQYKDATDSLTGMRYMIGIYNDGTEKSALTLENGDNFVIKSMSIKVTSAGVNQLVLHCRKAQATTNHTINSGGNVAGIHLLKINY